MHNLRRPKPAFVASGLFFLILFIGYCFYRSNLGTLSYRLAHASLVSVWRTGTDGPQEIAHLGPPQDACYKPLLSIRNSIDFHSMARSKRHDYIVYVTVNMGENVAYAYDSSTGELGANNEWCIAPRAFRLWMQRAAKHPELDIGRRRIQLRLSP